ncbi:MAG: aspartate carbamoyltransferase catalytic subunit [Rickettsiales bacterium]|nr:aspartate carbamoyltransferase catalytic subunit [Rickettsiales bacterium]|tara:strand:- start:373 stop:1287 length:915 start_codon:yes stop_codon:yes gene_type:complete
MANKHLLSIKNLSIKNINQILVDAERFLKNKKRSEKIATNKNIINLFFEDSTRTLTSFELAGKQLGASVINMSIATSSIKKGESLIDTAMTLNAMSPDILIVRHNMSGVPYLLSEKVNCSVINAGDGSNEHPTQALLDALTIKMRKKKIASLKVAIIGDVLHSRVARSNIYLLNKLGAKIRVISPPTLLPAEIDRLNIKVYKNLDEGLDGVDIIMVLRIQKERMEGSFVPSKKEFFKFWGLDREKLNKAKKNALVMHPGPINRGIEIDSDVADDIGRSLILEQVKLGVAIRMAVIKDLLRKNNE